MVVISPNKYVEEVEIHAFVKEIIVCSFLVASLDVESRSRETQPVCEPPREI